MKKIVIATLLATAALTASALEVGIIGTTEYTGDNSNGGGITLGTKVGPVGLTASLEQNDTLSQYPLTKSTAATLAFDRQYGQDRVQSFDGNRLTVGLKTSF